MKKHLLFLSIFLGLALFGSASAYAVEGVYLGGAVGAVGLPNSTAIGFRGDLGVRTNALLDVVLHFQASSHAASSNLYSPFLSADFHVLDVNDIDVALGGGPGFYFFKTPLNTDTKFGLNFGGLADVKVGEGFRVGVDARYHVVFSSGVSGDNFWTTMLRVGYLFGAE